MEVKTHDNTDLTEKQWQWIKKRHIIVDTLGLIMAIVIHAADIQDQDGAKLALLLK